MKVFKMFGRDFGYKEWLQLDGAFSAAHINYGKSPVFNNIDGKNLAKSSRKKSLTNAETINNVLENIYSFNDTEKDFKKNDKIILWKNYWLEYINSFDKMINSSPNSVVTVYIGRHAIEIGFKYLLVKKTGHIVTTHDLEKLSNMLYSEYNINDDYMDYVQEFCKYFSQYIEGGNAEYFRFPEYKGNTYFAGNCLDIKWLSYNLALIILKLIHFSGMDNEI